MRSLGIETSQEFLCSDFAKYVDLDKGPWAGQMRAATAARHSDCVQPLQHSFMDSDHGASRVAPMSAVETTEVLEHKG